MRALLSAVAGSAFVALATLSAPSQAEQAGLYFGIDVGLFDFDLPGKLSEFQGCDGGRCDDIASPSYDDTSFRLIGVVGMGLTEMVRAEAEVFFDIDTASGSARQEQAIERFGLRRRPYLRGDAELLGRFRGRHHLGSLRRRRSRHAVRRHEPPHSSTGRRTRSRAATTGPTPSSRTSSVSAFTFRAGTSATAISRPASSTTTATSRSTSWWRACACGEAPALDRRTGRDEHADCE